MTRSLLKWAYLQKVGQFAQAVRLLHPTPTMQSAVEDAAAPAEHSEEGVQHIVQPGQAQGQAGTGTRQWGWGEWVGCDGRTCEGKCATHKRAPSGVTPLPVNLSIRCGTGTEPLRSPSHNVQQQPHNSSHCSLDLLPLPLNTHSCPSLSASAVARDMGPCTLLATSCGHASKTAATSPLPSSPTLLS